jgi:hypothetical protein
MKRCSNIFPTLQVHKLTRNTFKSWRWAVAWQELATLHYNTSLPTPSGKGKGSAYTCSESLTPSGIDTVFLKIFFLSEVWSGTAGRIKGVPTHSINWSAQDTVFINRFSPYQRHEVAWKEGEGQCILMQLIDQPKILFFINRFSPYQRHEVAWTEG